MEDDEPKLGPVARRLAATQRIVCVEDEADIATFLRAYFRAAGFDLVHLDPGSVRDAIDDLVTQAPDAVLLDLRLRGFSGRDLYRALRADERWAFTPIVMVSADNDPLLRRSEGLDAFVAKPFNTDTLADIVRDRLQVAAELASTGRNDRLQLMTQRYLEARLSDEIAVAGPDGRFSFALARLLSRHEVLAEVGVEGLEHLVRQLIDQVSDRLPGDAVIGVSDANEVAVVFPSLDIGGAETAVTEMLAGVPRTFVFPGGARVPVRLAAGLASYPANATSPDELFMAADAALADAQDAGHPMGRAL